MLRYSGRRVGAWNVKKIQSGNKLIENVSGYGSNCKTHLGNILFHKRATKWTCGQPRQNMTMLTTVSRQQGVCLVSPFERTMTTERHTLAMPEVESLFEDTW